MRVDRPSKARRTNAVDRQKVMIFSGKFEVSTIEMCLWEFAITEAIK